MEEQDILKDEFTPDFLRYLARSKASDDLKIKQHGQTVENLKNNLNWETKQT